MEPSHLLNHTNYKCEETCHIMSFIHVFTSSCMVVVFYSVLMHVNVSGRILQNSRVKSVVTQLLWSDVMMHFNISLYLVS